MITIIIFIIKNTNRNNKNKKKKNNNNILDSEPPCPGVRPWDSTYLVDAEDRSTPYLVHNQGQARGSCASIGALILFVFLDLEPSCCEEPE